MKSSAIFMSVFIAVLLTTNAMASNRQARTGMCALNSTQSKAEAQILMVAEGEAFVVGIGAGKLYTKKFTPQTLPRNGLGNEILSLVQEAGSEGVFGFFVISWDQNKTNNSSDPDIRNVRGEIEIFRLGVNGNLDLFRPDLTKTLINEVPAKIIAATGQFVLPPVLTSIPAACELSPN